ncbi:MAG: pyruvate formate-lyase-activating protein [Bacillota bacterium]
MLGKIHSIETMGLADGPGIRFVVFFQGCGLRCKYCHNPDTWDCKGGKEVTAKEILEKALRYQPYFKRSGGGITCSGGDPLLQPEFLMEFLRLCKRHGLHTAIDTAGFGIGQYEEILQYTDLAILDIKHVDEQGYRDLTGRSMQEFLDFAEVLEKSNTGVWIRHVVVPGVTDSEDHIVKLKNMIARFKRVEKVELLPYHTLGASKYAAMGISYELEDIRPMCAKKTEGLKKILEIA